MTSLCAFPRSDVTWHMMLVPPPPGLVPDFEGPVQRGPLSCFDATRAPIPYIFRAGLATLQILLQLEFHPPIPGFLLCGGQGSSLGKVLYAQSARRPPIGRRAVDAKLRAFAHKAKLSVSFHGRCLQTFFKARKELRQHEMKAVACSSVDPKDPL